MSKYEELCSAYASKNEAQRKYWQVLQRRAANIVEGLWEYLDYPSARFPSVDGKTSSPYVQLSKPREDGECNIFELPGAGGAIQFDILVTLEEEPNSFPKSRIRFSLNIGSIDDELRVWDATGFIDSRLPIAELSNESIYAQIFEALKHELSLRPSMSKQ